MQLMLILTNLWLEVSKEAITGDLICQNKIFHMWIKATYFAFFQN